MVKKHFTIWSFGSETAMVDWATGCLRRAGLIGRGPPARIPEHARAEDHTRVYREVHPSKTDLLIWLQWFGFTVREGAGTERGELVLVKNLEPPQQAPRLDPLAHQIAYGPGSLRLERAHIVPIQDRYHQLLFPDADDQHMLFVGTQGCGNAIRKAYLCPSPSRRVQPSHGLLFARTGAGRSWFADLRRLVDYSRPS